MNKALRFLFLFSLLTLFFTSCNKEQESEVSQIVTISPKEGGSITFQKVITVITNDDTIYQKVPLNYLDVNQRFEKGDSLLLAVDTIHSGYTFINWIKNGKAVSTHLVYGFKVEEKDLDSLVDNLGMMKSRFEARFGLDYSIQEIPSIDDVMPPDLVAVMGPYLHFGDNPPRIDSCFFADSLRLARFIHNTDDPTTTYYLMDTQYLANTFSYKFCSQHRGIMESTHYERAYGDIAYGLGFFLFENANTDNNIYVMGNGYEFTIYYSQTCTKRMEPDESLSNYISDYSIGRTESVIISGRKTDEGIADFRMGMRVEEYSADSPRIGELHYLPARHDIFLYDYPNNFLRYTSF